MSANHTPFIPPLLTPGSSNRPLMAPDSPLPAHLQGRPPLLSPNAPIPPHIAAAWQQQQSNPPPIHRRAHSSPWTVPRNTSPDPHNMTTEEFLRSQPPPNVTTTWVGMNNGWPQASPYSFAQPGFNNTPVHPPASIVSSPPTPNLTAPWAQAQQPNNTPAMGYGFGAPPANFQSFTPMAAPPQQVWGAPPSWGVMQMSTPYGYPQQLGMQGMQNGMNGMGGMGGMTMAAMNMGMQLPQQYQQPPQAPPPQPMAPIPPSDNGDKIGPFTEGTGYGPVLETGLLKRLGCTIQLNPLLGPPPEDASDDVHLEWNMLFESTFVKRSSDPPRTSWSAGRGAPATFPRVTSLRLISRPLPWTINITASNKAVGVTCGDVIEEIARFLAKGSGSGDYKAQPHQRQIELGHSYRRHREIGHDVPGGRLGQGMLRLDWLGKTPQFGGIIVPKSEFVMERCGLNHLPGTFELRCIRSLPRTEQERADAEAAAAAAAARSAPRPLSTGPPRSSGSSSTGSSPIDIGIISPAPSNHSHVSSSHTRRSRATPGQARSRKLSQETASSASTAR